MAVELCRRSDCPLAEAVLLLSDGAAPLDAELLISTVPWDMLTCEPCTAWMAPPVAMPVRLRAAQRSMRVFTNVAEVFGPKKMAPARAIPASLTLLESLMLVLVKVTLEFTHTEATGPSLAPKALLFAIRVTLVMVQLMNSMAVMPPLPPIIAKALY